MTPKDNESSQTLALTDFNDFFREVHGYEPFPWQTDLVRRVHDNGWPALIDVPTGLGKTAVLDIAIFLNALSGTHARRRIFLVVDRRIIVDQAHLEAEKIRRKLQDPVPGGVCARISECLKVPGDDAESVVDVTRMRGGVDWSWLWIERPDRYAMVTGTVDQVGSRLLFRGYGLSQRLQPIDAAMVGTDSLIIIDEAHLSDPFFSTLRDALALDRGGVGRPPIVVAMSASPDNSEDQAHGISDADTRHPVAGKRLKAAKSLHTVTVAVPAAAAGDALADALAHWARQLGSPGKVVGVVANTVHMARATFERLRSEVADSENCVLLTGRVRPIDREYLLDSWYPRIRSGSARDPEAEMYVVATQTIEAGADIDVDGLVTQSASLPALVQRLGRLNRLGERANSRAVVVHAEKLADPVYGPAAVETWRWLGDLVSPVAHKAGRSVGDLGEGKNVSPAAVRELLTGLSLSQRERMRGAKSYVPALSAATLDAWVRTSPEPHPDAPVAPYLHGINMGEPTASVVWRSDLEGDDPRAWERSTELIPPSADEAIELPVGAVRRWLMRLPAARAAEKNRAAPPAADTGVSDLESQETGAAESPASARSGPQVLCYRGLADSDVGTARQIRPGDFVIVPSRWGGCDRYGWYPDRTEAVTDIADFTGWRGRRTTAIRIGSVFTKACETIAPDLHEQIENFISQVKEDLSNESSEGDEAYRDRLKELLAGRDQRSLPHDRVLARLAKAGRLTELEREDRGASTGERGVVALFASAHASWNEDGTTSGSSISPKPLTLAEHQAAVARRAREIALNLDLPAVLATAVERAAVHHDEGKRDFRFQVMLHGGDRLRARVMADQPLAKSGMDPSDRAAFRRAADLSGYPPNMRHEALSSRIVALMLEQARDGEIDKDLVVHLVAAHHGFARPLLPPIVDPHPGKVAVQVGHGPAAIFDTADTVDWDGPERFERLCGRYGRWGLALLESIVRLADIWCSARSEGRDDRH